MASYKKFEIRRRNPDPKTSALLVIDMQNYFSSIAKPIISSIQTTIELCRRAHVPVIYTRHCEKSPADYNMLAAEWWDGEMIIDGTPESELLPEVESREGDLVVEKDVYGAFTKTQLEQRLLEMDVKEGDCDRGHDQSLL